MHTSHRHLALLTACAVWLTAACRAPTPAVATPTQGPVIPAQAGNQSAPATPTTPPAPITQDTTMTSSPATAPITVDVYADLVCPWCFVGAERLNQAVANTGLGAKVTIRHHAFLLNPDTPPEGVNIPQMLRQKYGRDPEQIFATVHQAARDTGIALDLHKQPLSYPTWASHALLRHAEAKGTQLALKHSIFWANFMDGRNIADVAVLTELAAPHGFTAEEVRTIIADPAERELTLQEVEAARRLGISGVPYFVVNGKRAVSGAQPVAVLERMLRE